MLGLNYFQFSIVFLFFSWERRVVKAKNVAFNKSQWLFTSLAYLNRVWGSMGVTSYNRWWGLRQNHKNYFKGQSLINSQSTLISTSFFWLNEMAILLNVCKPFNLESHNSLKLSFTNTKGLHSNFSGCESFLESKSPDIFTLWGTN